MNKMTTQATTPHTEAPKAWMRQQNVGVKSINADEGTSLTALIAYVAYTKNQHEFRIERMLADKFNIPNVKCLPSDQYDNAVLFLMDFVGA